MKRIDTKTGQVLEDWQNEIISRDINDARCIVSAVENLMFPGNRSGLADAFPEFHKQLTEAAAAKVAALSKRYRYVAEAA